MKKRLLGLLLAFAMLAAVMPAAVVYAEAGTKPSVGDGSEDNPYEIGTADELLWFADRVSDGGRASICAVLTADITVNPGTFDVNGTYTPFSSETATTWTPIGISENYPYSGTFDGQNHTISGIYYDSTTADYIGLFGYTSGATIKNVALTNSYIRGNDYVGGIVGYDAYNMTITNCYNAATVRGTGSDVGGVIGYLRGTIEKCGNSGVISCDTICGGVIGYGGTTIDNCYNTASVQAESYAGGVIGATFRTSVVRNCHNVGSTTYGIVAKTNADLTYSPTITNCYTLDSSVSTTTNGCTIKNATAFSSGEVAYLLQGSQSEDVWGQYIGYEDYPSLGGKKVYYNSTEDEYYNINSVSLDTSAVTLAVGDGAAINATLTPTTAQASDISWSSSNVYVATVSSSGKVLAIAEGTAVITAAAGEKKAYCVVTVASSSIDVIAVTLDKSALTLTAGDTSTLAATVYPDDATDKTVTWTSSDESVATVSGGTVTAVSAGSVTITAAAGAYSASCTVTVEAANVDVTSIMLDKSALTLTTGDTSTLTANVYPDDATDKTVTWTSSDESVATVSGGTVTAVSAGSATITATAGAYSASCTVTVTEDNGYAYVINGLSLVSETGETLDSAPVGSGFIVDVSFTEVKSRTAKDYVFVAVYDTDGALMSLDYISSDFTPNTEYNVGFHIAAQSAAVGKVKAFIWDAFGSMTPLAEETAL